MIAGLPVREFRWYKGRRHYSGWYWCATGQRLVVYESRLELARIMLADFDPAVTAVAAQPFRLIGRDGSRVRRHVPDLLLAGADGGVTVVDVKAPGRRADPEVRASFAWTRQVAALRGWAFEEWYGADRRGCWTNVRFLAGYRRGRAHRRGLHSGGAGCRAGTGRRSPSRAGAVSAVSIRSLVRPVVLHLLWTGVWDGPEPAVGRGQRDPAAAREAAAMSGRCCRWRRARGSSSTARSVEVMELDGCPGHGARRPDRWRTLGLAGFLPGGIAPLEAPSGLAGVPPGPVPGGPDRRSGQR